MAEQTRWTPPQGIAAPTLHVNNTLNPGQLTPFVPLSGKLVRWYLCGPTVYDATHLGHARTYLSFDILRRILEDYFGYNLFVCMNITDVEDKIIRKACETHLFETHYKAEGGSPLTADLVDSLKKAWEFHIGELEKHVDKLSVAYAAKVAKQKQQHPDKDVLPDPELELFKQKIAEARASQARFDTAKVGDPALGWLQMSRAAYSEYLNKTEGPHLDSALVKKLCEEVSQKYELEYFEDMKALGVKGPDVLVRVTEEVPQVVEYIKKIVDNGYAYEAGGDVYFDTTKFQSGGHCYRKLRPENTTETENPEEEAIDNKKNKKDFALWKSAKPGEPTWKSPWSDGRPGWHIECSAMASKVLGESIDVHCGGWDLMFPHHDNELAQSEAYYDHHQWVNYFLHTGHLHIDGLKMAKSLKNFVTIREAMAAGHNATQIRFLFLVQGWDRNLQYQRKNTMENVDKKIKSFSEFLRKVKQCETESNGKFVAEAWNAVDVALHTQLLSTQETVHARLCANFDTAGVIQALLDLVTGGNKYMSNNNSKKALLLTKVANYINKILSVFGVPPLLAESSAGSVNREEVLRPCAQTLVDFRKEIRSTLKVLNSLCDKVRDETAPLSGVKIVDDDPAFDFYLVDPAELAREARQKEADAELKKLRTQLNKESKLLNELRDASSSPQTLILSLFGVKMLDGGAFPEKNEKGEAIPQKTKANITKKYKSQEVAHQKYLQQVATNPNIVGELDASVKAMEARMKELESQ